MQNLSRVSQRLIQLGRLINLLLVFALVLAACDTGSSSNQNSNPTKVVSQDNGTKVAGDNNNTPTGSNNTPDMSVPPTDTAAPPPPMVQKVGVKVNNAYDGSAVANASITVQQGSGAVAAKTDSSGEYVFDKLDSDAVATIVADGYAPTEGVKLNPGANTVSLMPAMIKGRVTDATTGKPLVNVMVRAYPPDAAAPAPVQATPPSTNSLSYGRPLAAPLMITDTTPAAPAADLGYVQVNGTGGDGLLLNSQPKRGAERLRVVPEGTILKVTGADIQDADLTWVPVSTTDDNTAGYVARSYVVVSAAPGAPTFTPPPPPTATPSPTPPPPSLLLQQPITSSNLITFTNANGEYTLYNVPLNPVLHFKYSGYKLTKVPTNREMVKDVALKQFHVKGLYYTAEWAASSDLFDKSLEFISKKDINTIVLNVQDNGSIALVYPSNIPLAKEVGQAKYFDDLPAFIKKLQNEYNLYVIARVVCFVQPGLVNNRPDLAVTSSLTGKPIKGGLGQLWLDPTNPASVNHILSIINEVKDLGFDEVQMDYMRFLSDTPESQGEPVFKAGRRDSLTWQQRAEYVQSFVSKAYEITRYTDVFLSGDVFGYILWPDQPEGPVNRNIGQIWEYVINHLDYISPMIYPSHFSPGEQGFDLPNDHPYEIIKKSGEYAMERFARTGDNPAKYRPWLQYFTMNGNLDYTGSVIRLQTKAADETGTWGWMMWDASNAYIYPDAFDPKK